MFRSDAFITAKKEAEACVRALRCLEACSTDIDGAESYMNEDMYNYHQIMKEIRKLRKQLEKVQDAVRLSAGTTITEVGLYEIRNGNDYE